MKKYLYKESLFKTIVIVLYFICAFFLVAFYPKFIVPIIKFLNPNDITSFEIITSLVSYEIILAFMMFYIFKEEKKDYKNFLKASILFILYLIISSSPAVLLFIIGVDTTKMSDIAKVIYSLVYELLTAGFIIFFYSKELKSNLKEYFKNKGMYFKKYIKYWFIALGLMMASNIFVQLFTTEIAKNEAGVRNILAEYPVYAFISAVVIAPIIEEVIFRFMTRKATFGINWFYVLMSGLMFGSMHVVGNITSITDVLYLIPYSMPGFVFAYTYLKSNNIFVPISLHMIHNGVLITLQILLAL